MALWTNDEVDQLINLMKSKYLILWNTDELNYSKRHQRDAAMRKLTAELGSRGK